MALHRYFDTVTGDHFYTTRGMEEMGTTTNGGDGKDSYKCEGVAAYVAKSAIGPQFVPFYRYYNGKDHFYTTDKNEIGTTKKGATGKQNYKFEGIEGYIANTLPQANKIVKGSTKKSFWKKAKY